MNEQKVINLISSIAKIDEAKIEILQKTGGMSNHTYIFKTNDEKFTFRIPGNGDQMFVKRKEELDILENLKDANFMPKTFLTDYENGYKISEFLEGEDLSKKDSSEINFKEVADLLKQVHTTDIMCSAYHPIDRLKWYESNNEELDVTFYELKDQWLKIYAENKSDELCFCHNDSQKANIIQSDKGLKIIDFEFAALNEIEYDIASFGNNDFADALKLAEVYFADSFSTIHLKRVYMWRIFQCLQWHNVAKTKAKIGLGAELGIDFDFVAGLYLTKAADFLNKYQEI